MNKKDKAAVQALLQSKSAEADEDLSLQPQAKVRNEFCSHFLLSKFANVFTEKTPKTESFQAVKSERPKVFKLI